MEKKCVLQRSAERNTFISDVMDGIFVPNISFGIPVLKSIHRATAQVMDVHLMITEPIRYINAFAEAGADLITIHYEACENVRETIEKIRETGVKSRCFCETGYTGQRSGTVA